VAWRRSNENGGTSHIGVAALRLNRLRIKPAQKRLATPTGIRPQQ
jgi:hypothetical protein